MKDHSSEWFHFRIGRPDAHLRLLCFPAAGGSTVQYFNWPDLLPTDIEVGVAQLPGRERRKSERFIDDAETLLQGVMGAVSEMDDRPLALYGHSMGAVMAFEVARRCQASLSRTPVHVFAAARNAPQLARPARRTTELTDAEFARELQHRWGAMPTSIANDPDLLAYFLPVIRADISVLETYRYAEGPRLQCPLSVYGGTADPSTTPAGLQAWQDQTSSAFRLRMFEGDHYFPQSLRGPLLDDMVAQLRHASSCNA